MTRACRDPGDGALERAGGDGLCGGADQDEDEGEADDEATDGGAGGAERSGSSEDAAAARKRGRARRMVAGHSGLPV